MVRLSALITILLLIVLAPSVQTQTLDSLLTSLRGRTGDVDTATSWYSDATAIGWINQAQDAITRLGGFLPTYVDYTYSQGDTLGYVLPTTFKQMIGAMVLQGLQWEPMFETPMFAVDTDPSFSVMTKNKDTTVVYFKGLTNASIGQRIRFHYLARATPLDSLNHTSDVPIDLHWLIIDQAFSYYLTALRMFQPAFSMQQQVRSDMGGKQ